MIVFSLLAAAILFLGLFFSFYRTSSSGQEPRIVLPEETLPGQSVTPPATGPQTSGPGGIYQEIRITPENVQSVIASLSRPVAYTADISAAYSSLGASLTRHIRIFKSGDFVKIEQADESSNPEKYTMTGGGRVYIWRAGDTRYFSGAQGDISADDDAMIPTYEDILSYPRQSIQSAGTSTLSGGQNCVFAEILDDETGYLWRYDVWLDTGLLAEAEAYSGGELVYKMSLLSFSSETPSDDVFMLPDGRRVK